MSRRVRRLAKATAAVVLVVLFTTGCTDSGFPTAYGDQVDPDTGLSNVEANWLEGCEVGFENQLAVDANEVCACSYRSISAPVSEGGIEFEDFVELNNDLRGDPTALASAEALTATESRLIEIVKSCIASS